MSFKPIIQTVMLLIAGMSGIVCANNSVIMAKTGTISTVNAIAVAKSDEQECRSPREILWDNSFTNSTKGIWYNVKYTGMPEGQQSCLIADDFYVTYEEIWQIDKIRVAMYWYGRSPDAFVGRIYETASWSPTDDALHEFQFNTVMPQELTIYTIDIDVTQSNIILASGVYWLNITSVYNNATVDSDTCSTAWLEDTIQIGDFTVNCKDSLGLFYGEDNIPTPWYPVWFNASGEQHSVWFVLEGSKVTAIKSSKSRHASTTLYKNAHSNNLEFNLENMSAGKVVIYDINGKCVKTVRVDKTIGIINTHSLANGAYLYTIIGTSEKTISKGKFTIAR